MVTSDKERKEIPEEASQEENELSGGNLTSSTAVELVEQGNEEETGEEKNLPVLEETSEKNSKTEEMHEASNESVAGVQSGQSLGSFFANIRATDEKASSRNIVLLARDDPIDKKEESPNSLPENNAPPPLRLTRAAGNSIARRQTRQFPGAYSVGGSSRPSVHTNGPDSARRVNGAASERHPTEENTQTVESQAFPAEVVDETESEETPAAQVQHQHLVVEGEPVKESRCGRRQFHCWSLMGTILLLAIIVLLAVGLSGFFRGGESKVPDQVDTSRGHEKLSTLERIQKRGTLRAGLQIIPEIVNDAGVIDFRDASLVCVKITMFSQKYDTNFSTNRFAVVNRRRYEQWPRGSWGRRARLSSWTSPSRTFLQPLQTEQSILCSLEPPTQWSGVSIW